MGKPKRERELADNQAMAMARLLRSSPRKLNLVAQLIRGLKAEQALNQLTFNRRRIAREVKKVLMSAIANAENNHDLDVDRLVVAEASVGKSLVMKRIRRSLSSMSCVMNGPYLSLMSMPLSAPEVANSATNLRTVCSLNSGCSPGR